MQMVSVLALNKLELKEMIDAEMVENPVLEEIDETVPMLDEVASRQEHDLTAPGAARTWVRRSPRPNPKTPFNEIDFGSYFQDYLDPGYRTQPEYEDSEKPSFENFLSQPTTLSDHLAWQLGALTLEPNWLHAQPSSSSAISMRMAIWRPAMTNWSLRFATIARREQAKAIVPCQHRGSAELLIERGIDLVQHLDPAGVGARDLRECLLIQIAAQQAELSKVYAQQRRRNRMRMIRDAQLQG